MSIDIWYLWQDCYLLDQGGIKIFIWKGKKASKTERAESLKKAEVSRTNQSMLFKGTHSPIAYMQVFVHKTCVKLILQQYLKSHIFKLLFQSKKEKKDLALILDFQNKKW